jgi:hypothetical protein
VLCGESLLGVDGGRPPPPSSIGGVNGLLLQPARTGSASRARARREERNRPDLGMNIGPRIKKGKHG